MSVLKKHFAAIEKLPKALINPRARYFSGALGKKVIPRSRDTPVRGFLNKRLSKRQMKILHQRRGGLGPGKLRDSKMNRLRVCQGPLETKLEKGARSEKRGARAERKRSRRRRKQKARGVRSRTRRGRRRTRGTRG